MPLSWTRSGRPVPPTIHPLSPEVYDGQWRQGTNNQGAATFGTANRAIFFPFYLTEAATFVRAFVVNGATQSGNIDIGIYDANGIRLVSTGGTALSGATTTQSFTLSSTTLAGMTLYYLAMVVDNPSAIFAAAAFGSTRNLGSLMRTSSYPLPVDASSWVVNTFNTIPFFGIARTTAF